jgi:glycosyltransferase involved in cell wall biosynthesis
MIVKNEAEVIGRCLASVKAFADEIVVVDTGSSDDTADIAARTGARVIRSDWRDDFSYSRNLSLKQASCEWILWLDGDDVVPASSVSLINNLKSRHPDRVFGFIVKNEKPGNTGSEFIQARMFPNRTDIYFERRIHEQMMPSALRLGLRLEECAAVIEHHGYADAEKVKEKSSRNVRLLLTEWDASHPDAIMAIEIADSYFTLGNFTDGEIWYRTVLSIPECEKRMPEIASQACLGIGNIKNRQERFTDAIPFLQKAIRLCPNRADALFSLAVALDLSGDLHAAAMSLKTILAGGGTMLKVGVDFREATIKAYLRLERIMNDLGESAGLLTLARQAAEALSHRPEILNMAGRVFFRNGLLMDALHSFEKSLSIDVASNCEAYIGLCQVYCAGGRQDHAEKTMQNIRTLFETKPVFWAYRRMIFGHQSDIEIPSDIDKSAVDREAEALAKLFSGK